MAKKSDQIISLIKEKFPDLNENQLECIKSVNETLQIVAGPGSGKTMVIVLRALYILLTKIAEPKKIMITTFTEKAAFEIRDRLHQYARLLNYSGHIYEIKIGTINSICDDLIRRFISYTRLKKNYDVLDELSQSLFINEKFNKIFPEETKINNMYLGKWQYKWTAIRGIIPYLNKITEELIEVKDIFSSKDEFIRKLAIVYLNYEKLLFDSNKIDFSHQQKIIYSLLTSSVLKEKVDQQFTFIMVDEYQDTNYVQEQILLLMAKPLNYICVVGDEDQALYRFRGATVRNILEFRNHFEKCKMINLSINYRSHKDIISAYNQFINGISWTDTNNNLKFRFDKTIIPNPANQFPSYPAVFCIWGTTPQDEAKRFAQLIKYLKDNNIVEDYSQIALLMHSVRSEFSQHYLDSLERHGIPYYAPRAKTFFENEEIKLMIGSYAFIFGFYGDQFLNLHEYSFQQLIAYIDSCISDLGPYSETSPQLVKYLRQRAKDIATIKKGETLDMHVIDYFYELLSLYPFSKFLLNENRARNLATFSQLVTTFQNYYKLVLITAKNKEWFPKKFFVSFLKLLLANGIDDYEDPDNPIPKGYVQIMTIHQSKGLEFPVVIVSSLSQKKRSIKHIDRDLGIFYHRATFEPEERMSEFDNVRQYYVAFSRAEKLLILTSTENPNQLITPIWEGLSQWPYVKKDVLKTLKFKPKKPFVPKKSFSLTSHINVFEVCPSQYQFYQFYRFSPSRSATMTFGTLVHQTIEDIHKNVLDGRLIEITKDAITNKWFETNYRTLINAGMRPLSFERKNYALTQVLNYFYQNYDYLDRVIETEVDVSVEKISYILTGKIDLLLGKDNKLELLDFKTQKRPNDDDPLLERYYHQLCVYAHILKERYEKEPDRFYIYWTGESSRKKALMEFPIDNKKINLAGQHFDSVVFKILNKEFNIKDPPSLKICKECDFRMYCSKKGIIEYNPKHSKSRKYTT